MEPSGTDTARLAAGRGEHADPALLAEADGARLPRGHVRAHARVITVGALAKFCSFPGQSYWISGFVDPILAATGVSRATLSGAYAAATLVSATWSTRIGRLADTRGVLAALLVASIGVVVGSLTLSVSTSLLAIIASIAVVRASGQGGMPLTGTLAIVRGMPEPRGHAMGLSNSVLTISGAVTPLAAAAGIATIGWRPTLVCAAAFVALATLVQLALLRPIPAVRQRPPRSTSTAQGRPPLGAPGAVLLYVLGLAPMTVTAIVFHASWYGANAGLGLAAVASGIALLAVFGIPGSLAGGWVADHVGVRAMLLLVAMAMVLAPLAVALGSAAGFFVGFAIAGVASGASGVAGSVAWSRTFGDEQIGRFQGIGAAGVITGASLGPLIPSGVDLVGAPPWAGALVLAALAVVGMPLALRWRPAS